MDLPGEADVENGAEWMCGKRSALHVPTQRAAMTDAVRCDGLCTAGSVSLSVSEASSFKPVDLR